MPGTKWGIQCNSRLLLYKNYILPKIVYGEELFDKGQITTLEKLQKFQNRALNVVSNTRKSLPIAARHQICQVAPLFIRRQANILNLYNRLSYNKENPANTIFTDTYNNTTHRRNRNKIKTTFVENVKQLRRDHNLQPYTVNSMPKPIEHWALNLIEVDTSLTELIDAQDISHNKMTIVYQHLRTHYPNHTHIYCDGSKNKQTGQTGIGIYDMNNNQQHKIKLNTHLNVDTIELAAASYSSKYINSALTTCNSVIISDSLHTCNKLKRYNNSEERIDLINVIHKFAHNIKINNGSLAILWVPAHINLIGHDIADRLAKEATRTQNTQTHDIGYSVSELNPIRAGGGQNLPSPRPFRE